MSVIAKVFDAFKQPALNTSGFVGDAGLWTGQVPSLFKGLEDSRHVAATELAALLHPAEPALASRRAAVVNTARAGKPLPDGADPELASILYWLKHPHQDMPHQDMKDWKAGSITSKHTAIRVRPDKFPAFLKLRAGVQQETSNDTAASLLSFNCFPATASTGPHPTFCRRPNRGPLVRAP